MRGRTGLGARARSSVVAVIVVAMSAIAVGTGTGPAAADTRNQVDVGPDVNCNLNGLHQNQGPVSTCGDLTITTQVLVNGVDVPAGTVLAVGDVVTIRVTIPPRGGNDAFYQETVDGIRNNARDERFALDVTLPGQTGSNLSAPTNVQMSRTDNGDRGNAPLINCLAQNGQEGAQTDGATAVTLGGGPVGATQMNAAVSGSVLTARWDQLAYDRCVNVLSNNGYYAGMTLSFDQTVQSLGAVPLTPTWTMGQVRMERKDGSRAIHWGSNADVDLTLPATIRPHAVADSAIVDAFYGGQASTSVSVDPLANDSGEGPLMLTAVSPTLAGGTVSCGPLPGAGPCTYTPAPGYAGTDTFSYTVRDDNGTDTAQVTVVVVPNGAPVAQDDLGATTTGKPATGSVAGNDSDPDGDPLSYATTAVTGPAHGTVAITAAGAYTYTPDAGFFGTDSFTYRVCDAHPMRSGPATSRCTTAQVTVAVDPGAGPAAVADTAQTDTGDPVVIDVRGNDDAGDSGPITVTFAGTNGSAGATAAGGTVTCGTTCTYTPASGFSGADAFSYTITDAAGRTSSTTVTVVVKGNHAPVAVGDTVVATQDGPGVGGDLAANDVELDGEALVYDTAPVDGPAKGSVTIAADGSFTYTPAAGASGSDSFTYRVCDDHAKVDGTPAPACATAKATVAITATPLVPPVAVEDGLTTDTDISAVIDPLANDSDPDGAAGDLVVSFVGFGAEGGTTQAGGTVSCVSQGCTYTPPTGFSGTDVFRYTVTDADGLTASAVVVVQVRGNHPPVATDDLAVTPVDTTVRGDLLANDTEIDGEDLVVTTRPVTDPEHGTLTIAADGTYTYVPDPGFSGKDSFVYEVCDDHELVDGSPAPRCSQAEATVLVGYTTVDDLPDGPTVDIHDNVVGNGNGNGNGSGAGGGGSNGSRSGGSSLARTGADLVSLIGVGAALLVAGIVVLRGRRRRLASDG